MASRSPNQSQYWYCRECGKKTLHIIPDLDSEWIRIDGTNTYKRWRKCQRCKTNLRTYELPASKVDRMLRDIDQLRALEADYHRLIAALDSKRKAEAEISKYLPKEISIDSSEVEAT